MHNRMKNTQIKIWDIQSDAKLIINKRRLMLTFQIVKYDFK
jgi:hypothetical protein